MANNHGGFGSKFVSVNLNKLYGQPSHHNYPPHSGSYGPGVGTNRARPGGQASSGGGMVVLSRNRPLQKAAPKLSVPPPLNLPSLRKEYEKIDPSGSGGGVASGAGSGSGSRPSSSGIGWTKPGNAALQEKETGGDNKVLESVSYTDGSATRGSGTYMPPSARFGGRLGHGDMASTHRSNVASLEKAILLRGEDFPSLRSALPSSAGTAQKQKEGSIQKVKQLVSEESSNDLRNSSHILSPAHIQSSHHIASSTKDNGGQSPKSGMERVDHAQKQEDPLPKIWLNPRSDWADDERDTGRGFAGRSGRDQELPKNELYWDRDFDMPRSSILPHKPPNNLSERRGQHSISIAKGSTSEVLKAEPYRREIVLHGREDRESNSWRNSSIVKDRTTALQVNNEGNHVAWPDNPSNDKYMSSVGDISHNDVVTGIKDPVYVRRDTTHGRQGGQRHWTHAVESPRYRGEGYQNSAGLKSYSVSGKGFPINNTNLGREKPSFSKGGRTHLDDPFQKDFSSGMYDESDPFTGNLVGMVKRKKEVIKQTDFHDPVRESFEAELERVQKMQEMERQRIVEEQERALEQARREDEERRRVVMEEEERRRRMEEEAREAAWRAEQERLEAIQKAEEQKIAREEEKRRMLLEEERRKQAAKQKLLELEAKIAKREAEDGKTGPVHAADDEVPVGGKDSDASMDSDLDNWEVSQRMVERITISASSDSSAMDRPFDRPQFSRDGSSNLVDRGKPVNPWRRDAFEVGSNSSFLSNDQENGHHSPRREASIGGKSFPRNEIFGGGYMSSGSSFRGGMQDIDTDGFHHHRDQRWGSFGDAEPFSRNRDIESEFDDNVAEKYGEVSWGQGHSRGNARLPYSERLFMSSESDKLYPHGRSRYSMKQPRVLPPPSLASIAKSSVRGENELSAPSSSLESTARTGNYDGPQDRLEQPDLVDIQQEIMAQKLEKNGTPRCDSQSSLSVSSAPSSPTHLSHDEMDDSGGCSVIPSATDVKELLEHEALNDEPGEVTTLAASNSISADEDEEWSLENHDEMQEQEEYDEDDDGYREEDEVHEVVDENVKLTQEFEHMHLEEKSTNNVMDNLVLGFNEGVEVRISGDELERDLKTDGDAVEMAEDPTGDLEKHYTVIHEPEKAVEYSAIQSQSTKKPASNLLGDSSVSSGPSVQPTAPSAVDMSSNPYSGQTTVPILSSVSSQADLPVTLQFGLFSGPSLIPSPVPTIQIGSIQMPLHLHPPVGSSMGHIHPSQPPLFQFGQLRYTSPVSQGILPMTTQPVSLVQPNIHRTHLNLNQNSGSSPPNHMVSNKSLKLVVPKASSTGATSSKKIASERLGKEFAKATPTKTLATSSLVEGSLKRNSLEEDVDAPLQSGVVRVFKQPGIECPSDEDDFIEVRSKRQMLNDRREQREKEMKTKSRVTKQSRRPRSSIQGSNKTNVSLVGEASNNIRSDFVASEGRSLVNKRPSTDFSTMSSLSLAPIGTPAVDTDVQSGIRLHTSKILQRGPVSAISAVAEDRSSKPFFETENKAVDNVQTSLGDWGNARLDQQVIPLTQTQLDEAMKPARFNTHVTSIGDHNNLVGEPVLSSSLILAKGKPISSSSSPINSLLAGEKIQFGAVTSPTILPSSSRVVTHGIGAPGSFRPDIAQSISKAENNCDMLFKQDKHLSESCVLTDDCEAEVEAAASAVAVIDTDEIVGNGLGPVSAPVTKGFGGAVEVIQGGSTGDLQSGNQSKPEESLRVSLPADLSVETPISLWPPLPSPQGSSTQMLSHLHGAAPSPFPFYEMNHPMMSGPVFAFGRHEESGGTQSQSQKSTGSSSRHVGGWQNHSGIDSFYGPPAGYTGPFIGSPGGIPGVQTPPHMVVYNHYAPVGQFGQVGLSFMGATYIPSGKQPDWKHDPTSSASGRVEEDMNSMNMVSRQCNPPNLPTPIQHLSPGSSLLPMGSPLTMFDVPPFQIAPDMPTQACWPHVPASPLHAVPMSLPLQQQAGPSQFSSQGGHPVDQSAFPPNRFSERQSPTPSNSNGLVFPVVRDSTITQFSDELGLVDSSDPSISNASSPVTVSHISSGPTKTADGVQRGTGVGININNNNGGSNVESSNAFKNQHHQQGKNLSSQQYNHDAGVGGYGYQRGGVSPKNKSMGQWSHRRTGTGFHGRYQPVGTEKSFPSSAKVKQIYVAKQPASGGPSSTVG